MARNVTDASLLLSGGVFAVYPAVAGYPHVTLPMGKVYGLPVGVSLTGPAFSECKLIALAFAYEQITKDGRDRDGESTAIP